MAIASCHVSVVSRSSGRSAVAAAAYRSGEALYNAREGETYSYTQKTGIVYTEIFTPVHAPDWAKNREHLWNAVERAEKASNAQTAREIRIALPRELTQAQNIALARAYTQTFANEGMIADLSIHNKGDGNPHAHLLLTMRPLREDGTWAAKSRKAYVLDEHGEKIRLPSGRYKSYKVSLTDWDTVEKLVEWRERYQQITNDHLEKAGRPERIDVRSYEEQGIEQIPTKHLGHFAHQLEQQGIPSARGNMNRQIELENRQLHAMDGELAAWQEARQQELEKQEAERQAEAKRLTRQQWESEQREAAKRHQHKYTRPQEEASRRLAHPSQKPFAERIQDQLHEYRQTHPPRTRQHEEEQEKKHDH